MVTPLSTQDLEGMAREAIYAAQERLARFSGIELPTVAVDFSLRGRCAGQAGIKGRALWLRINLPLMARHLDDYLTTTIPHEVAHLHVLWVSRRRRNRPRPHGAEWQEVMRDCFNLEPQRCHTYRTTPARVVSRKFLYRCRCREHRLTSIMHNRIRRGAVRICRFCRQPLSTSPSRPGP